MLKMIVKLSGKNYLRDYDYGDAMVFVEEGAPVTIFDGELIDPEDVCEEFVEVDDE